MAQMPVIRTPIAMRDFAGALIRVLREMGVQPSKASCGVFWAQYALETGAGGFCWNHNLFNHKVTQSQVNAGVPYMMLANTWEVENGKRVMYQPPHPATRFKAYASFGSAMGDHVAAVKSGRYATSWPAVVAGDVALYATRLRERGYYTASLASYVALLEAKLKGWNVSTAYEDALADAFDASEAPTEPGVREIANDSDPPSAIVHPWHFTDDEPPPDAA
jgi:hypothetical protein